MNKDVYKSAMDNIQFSEDLSKKTLNYLSSHNPRSDSKISYKKQKNKNANKIFIAIACVLILMISIPMSNNKSKINNKSNFELPNSSGNISIKYTKKTPSISIKSDLEWLTEEELFHKYNTNIFMGEVREIRNIEINYNGSMDYRAIAKIKVNKNYRGNVKPGETVSVLLPSPIDTNISVEDTEIVSSMKIGMTGIFMPLKYDDSSYREENGARLYLKDIAEYGLLDGMRFMFLNTENGLAFDKNAYESIGFATTLEEIEQYIINMIK